jgi:hypothetical protein
MTGLYWKPNSAATVIHPLRKGTGESPERHRRGNNLKTRLENSIRVFYSSVTQREMSSTVDVVSIFELDVFSWLE